LMAGIVSGVLTVVFAPLAGLVSDRLKRKPLILAARLATVVLVYPGFLWLIARPSETSLLVVVGVLSILLAIQSAPAITMIPELFPQPVRATGMAIVYSLGVAVFGGFAPFVATWMINVSGGNKLAPAFYMIGGVVISSFALLGIRDRTGEVLDA